MKRVLDPAVAGDLVEPQANPAFAATLVAWQRAHGRHSLPWQNTRDPYRVWLSEIMLQQTQVAAVIPYYRKFLERFPDIAALATAPPEAVMAHWSGLGYYSRARNLHRCAQQVMASYGGVFPSDPVLLAELPGIGRSTAAAVAAFSYDAHAAILDGNVKRVFARVFGIDGYPGERRTEERLWRLAVDLLPSAPAPGEKQGADAALAPSDLQAYTQGLMDLGATLCTRSKPACGRCPLADRCVALATGRVAELPVRKPKKTVPQRHAVMLVVTCLQQVLLMQRPDSGIWGGLLSLPELDGFTELVPDTPVVPDTQALRTERDAAITRLLAPFGSVAQCERLQPFSHGFTHFRLHVVPYRVQLSERRDRVGESAEVWRDIADLATAPLPAPVKKLLLEIFERDDLFAA